MSIYCWEEEENFSRSLKALRIVVSWDATSVDKLLQKAASFNNFLSFFSASVTVILERLSTVQSETVLLAAVVILLLFLLGLWTA